MTKDSLRNEFLQKLSLLHRDELMLLSSQLTNQLVKFFASYPDLSSQIGGAYLPFKTEVAPVYQELLREVPLMLSYPIVENGEMKFGMPHGFPKGAAWLDPPYTVIEPEWVLIPGLGFDLEGGRLGRGKGFYDRFLENSEALRIGLCWSEQLKEEIPVEAHDGFMDFIITESFCYEVSVQKRF